MRKTREVTIAAVMAWTLSSMLMASPPNVSDEQVFDCLQSVQPVPATATYDMWAQWIRQQIARDAANYHDFRNGQFVPKKISADVDLITIQTVYHLADAGAALSRHEYASTTEATPVSLPVTGKPGEHVTIISQTPATYLSWTYVWKEDASHDAGGWQLTTNEFHDCGHSMANRPTGFHCDKPEAPAT
jgi:hypothetical protein